MELEITGIKAKDNKEDIEKEDYVLSIVYEDNKEVEKGFA